MEFMKISQNNHKNDQLMQKKAKFCSIIEQIYIFLQVN